MRRALFVLSLCATMSSSALAADARSQSIAKAIEDFAGCIEQHRNLADRFLSAAPGTSRAMALQSEMEQISCAYRPHTNADEGWVLRGAMFEARYKSEYGSVAPTSFQGIDWVDYAFPEGVFDKSKKFNGYDMAAAFMGRLVREYGDCIVRKQPQDAYNLVQTPVSSTAEDQAIKLLLESMSACLTDGAKMKAKPHFIRAYVAEALYKLSQAKASVPGVLKANQ